MNNYEKAIRLYKQFIDGIRWLNAKKLQNIDISKYEKRFKTNVEDPLNTLWHNLEDKEREMLDKLTKIVDMFDGDILIEDDRATFINTEANVKSSDPKDPLCQKCREPGTRFCFGNAGEKYKWGMYCLECEPYNE